MIKNKIKKIFVILSITLLTLCNFSYIYADESNNFDYLSTLQLEYFYQHKQNDLFWLDGNILNSINNDADLINSQIDKFGNITDNIVSRNIYRSYNRLQSSLYKQYKFDGYFLEPFKLNINNNGKGSILNSVNTEPYISTNIYYKGQEITLTYDNQYNDFKGWYIDENLVSSNLSYTFNIQDDTTITLTPILGTDTDDNYDGGIIEIISNITTWFALIFALIINLEIPLTSNTVINIGELAIFIVLIKLAYTIIKMFLTKNHLGNKD